MTVFELKEFLEGFSDEDEVVIRERLQYFPYSESYFDVTNWKEEQGLCVLYRGTAW